MHTAIVIAVVAIVIAAAVLYIRRHSAVAAKVEADAAALKNSAENEARTVEQAVEADAKAVEKHL